MIGEAPVGSPWAAAWLTVTVGPSTSHATSPSAPTVPIGLLLPAASVATPAAILGDSTPLWVMPETATVYVVPDPVTTAVVEPVVLRLRLTSPVAKSPTGSLKTTV